MSEWERVSVDWVVPAGQLVGAYAMCPGGKRPLGGGWYGSGDQFIVNRMEPDDMAYNVIVRSVVNYDSLIRVTAICAIAN